jgi:hypothetical protein
MRILTIAAATMAAAVAASGAFAAEARLTDGQFIKTAACRGLASGDEAARFDTILKTQKRGRADHVVDRAFNARSDAERLARTDAAAAQARLAGECAKIGA